MKKKQPFDHPDISQMSQEEILRPAGYIANNVYTIRKNVKKLTQKELAEKTRMSLTVLRKVEYGKNYKICKLYDIAQALDISFYTIAAKVPPKDPERIDYDTLRQQIGRNLISIRKRYDESREKVALAVKIDVHHMREIELGITHSHLLTYMKIALYWKLSFEDIISETFANQQEAETDS